MSDGVKLPDWVRPGRSFRLDYGPDNPNTGRKIHIRAIVDGRAVVREWLRSKASWRYRVEHPYWFEAAKDNIRPVGKG